MNIEVQKEIEKVRVVDSNRNYWFIRTYGGETYNDYIENNYVGIGFNDVPFDYIDKIEDTNDESKLRLRNYLENKRDFAQGEATRWMNQLITFQHRVKKGDVVIIPDKNSNEFNIGIVESDIYVVDSKKTFYHNDSYESYPEKRRQINWVKNITKREMNFDLRGMTSTHSAISNANKFYEAIEGFITSVYILEDKMHLVLKINRDEDINAFDLNDFLYGITYFYREFCIENGIEDNRDLTIKIKLQSKGKLALQAFAGAGLLAVMGVISLSKDAGFKAEIEGRGSVEINTGDSFLNTVSDFLDRNQEREIRFINFRDSIKNLEVKKPSLDNNTLDEIAE